MISRDETDERADANGNEALDQHPTKILEVLEKRFYWAALFVLYWVKAFLSGFIRHGWSPLGNQTFVPGEDWETV